MKVDEIWLHEENNSQETILRSMEMKFEVKKKKVK